MSDNVVKAIRLRTHIPGPRSRALLERRERSVARGVVPGIPICVERAEGALVTDVDGNRLIDFAGGLGSLNVGHAPAPVVAAIVEQAKALLHSCFMVASYESYVGLAEDLIALTPGTFAKKVVLLNTGSEAVENAVKVARVALGRDAVVVFSHAYHGRTLLTMTMTAKHANYKRGFGPFAPEVYRAPAPYPYRGVSVEDAVAGFERLIRDEIGVERVAAVVIEPVAGEGGYLPVPAPFLRHLRATCDEIGAALVVDEVQSGFGRTGRMFAIEHAGVEPDLLCLAKSLSAGMPLSAVVGRAELLDAPLPGGLGGTFSGNPVACAAARAAVELMRDPAYLERARSVGEVVARRFAQFQSRFPSIGEVRALGPMAALEFVVDPQSRQPAKALTEAIWRNAYKRGLMLARCGMYDNVIRFAAPIVIGEPELTEGLDVFEAAIAEAEQTVAPAVAVHS